MRKIKFTILILFFLELSSIACPAQDIHNERIENLIKRLRHKNSNVRKYAARIANSHKDSIVVNALIHALKDNEISVRIKAIESLGKIGDKRAAGPLLSILSIKNADKKLKDETAIALGRIGDPAAVEPLISILNDKDKNEYIKITAVNALAHIGSPDAVDALIGAMGNYNFKRRGDIYLSFIRFNEKDKYVIEAVNKAAISDNKEVRTGAIKAIRMMAANLPPPFERTEADKIILRRLAKPVIARLNDEDSDVRRYAIKILKVLKVDTAVNGLINSLYKEKDWKLRKKAANTLLYIKKISEYEPSAAAKIEKESRARLKFLPKEDKKRWIEIRPVLCEQRPWEVDWSKSHEKSWVASHGFESWFYYHQLSAGEEYETGIYYGSRYVTVPEEAHMQIQEIERKIIKDYFAKQGIDIVDILSIDSAKLLDESHMHINCMDIRYFFLQVHEKDIDKMISMGYKAAEE